MIQGASGRTFHQNTRNSRAPRAFPSVAPARGTRVTAPKAFRTPENIFAATSKRGRKNSRQPARRVASGPHHRDPPTAPSVLRAIASGSVDMWSGDARQRMRALTARARSGCGGGCDPGVIRVWCGCGAGVVDCGKPPTGRRDGSIGIEGVAGSRGAGSRPLERPNLRESSVIPRFGPRRHTPHPARLPRRTNPRKLAVNEGVAQSVEHRPFKPLVLGSNPSALIGTGPKGPAPGKEGRRRGLARRRRKNHR